MPAPTFTSLDVAIIGAGLGGLAAAISLRRSGHRCTIYERRDLASEVGNSISCAKSTLHLNILRVTGSVGLWN
jgi:salicylate hydroxylase